MKRFARLAALGAFFLTTASSALAQTSAPPQTPVSLVTATGTLYGTLEMPASSTRPVPVALIIAGSGPTDRDGNSGKLAGANTYALLADALAARGIATVRYDKRGIAASAEAMPKPLSAISFDIFADDAAAWVGQLRADKRFSRVALVGHSEGGLIATIVAGRTPVDAVVDVAGPGRPLATILRAQVAASGPGAAPFLPPFDAAVASLKAGKTPTDVPPELASVFPAYLTTFLTQLFSYEPAALAKAVRQPLAIVRGTDDVQILDADAQALKAANAHAVLTIVPHMTHMLKDAKDDTRAASLATYTDKAAPLDPMLVDAVAAGVTATK